MTPETRSPLDTLDDAFRILTRPPAPLALDGREVGGLPPRLIPLDELRSMLLHPSCGYRVRDAAMFWLVCRAQDGPSAWTVGLAGVLLPGLRSAAGRLARGFPGDTADLDAEILSGFVAALPGFDPAGGKVASRLLWAAYRSGHGLRCRERTESARCCHGQRSAPPPPLWSHPDFVLADAAAQGVISKHEAQLIGATRLDDLRVSDIAADLGVSAALLRQRRYRAERRLVAWLTQA